MINPPRRGFTLIEMLVVMAIVGLMLTIALPRYFGSLDKSRDVALRENLQVLRTTIDKFYGDRGRYPETLEELVEQHYLRAVPVDPVTGASDSWVLVSPPEGDATGIVDVRSGARGQDRNGVPYESL